MKLHTEHPIPGCDYNAVAHLCAGWSEGFQMIHVCMFHRYNASARYVSLYLPDMYQLVLLINMIQPDAVTIMPRDFPGGSAWKMEATSELVPEGDARWMATE